MLNLFLLLVFKKNKKYISISETCYGGLDEDCNTCRASKNRTFNSET